MMKRLMELKKEKEDLALEVEREEELLTNTLQKKLNQVRAAGRALAGRRKPAGTGSGGI